MRCEDAHDGDLLGAYMSTHAWVVCLEACTYVTHVVIALSPDLDNDSHRLLCVLVQFIQDVQRLSQIQMYPSVRSTLSCACVQ